MNGTDLGFAFSTGNACGLNAPSLTRLRLPSSWGVLAVSVRGGYRGASHFLKLQKSRTIANAHAPWRQLRLGALPGKSGKIAGEILCVSGLRDAAIDERRGQL
jgi:hypothetical protein